jgi:hypothetical protein
MRETRTQLKTQKKRIGTEKRQSKKKQQKRKKKKKENKINTTQNGFKRFRRKKR